MRLVLRLILVLVAFGVALAPLGSIAHANGHANANFSVTFDDHMASHKGQNTGHDVQSSSKPCDTKSDDGATNCCALGCHLILAETTPFLLRGEKLDIIRVVLNAEEHNGTHPTSLDPPPRA